MSMAFLFPGQGSQAIGMGQPLAEAFATARDGHSGKVIMDWDEG